MCGIVGGLRAETYNDITPEAQNEILRIMTVELLLLTEERGSDATGFAMLFEDGNMRGMKHGEKASKVVQDFNRGEKNNFLALMDIWKYYKSPANIVMGHCRKKTTGLATDNRNNHPFKIGNIFGIHNGHIENHFKIERLLKEEEKVEVERAGTVDSEMIFHLLSRAVKKEKIMTLDQAEWVVDRLQGKYAVMAANVNNPYQVMLFRDGRPIEIALSRPAGLIFISSEKKFFETALFRYRRIKEYYGLDYLPELELTVATMPDDHAWIFNLAHKIEKTTSVNDLVEAKKMPWLAAREKEWQNTVITNNTNWRRHNNQQQSSFAKGPGATTPNTDVDKDKDKKKEDDDITTSGRNCQHLDEKDVEGKWIPGRVWCRDTRTYKDKVDSANDTKKEEKKTDKEHSVLTTDEKFPDDIQEDTNEDVAVYGNTEINDMSSYVIVQETSGKERGRASDNGRQTRRKVKGNAVKSVDASEIVDDEKKSTLADAVKMYSTRHGHFSNLPDALVAAELKEEKLLSTFDFKVVASRIKKKAIEQGFRDGYEAAMKQTDETSRYTSGAMQKALVKQTNKKKKAEYRIQKLKALALALIECVPIHIELDDVFLHDLDARLGPHYSLTMKEAVDLFSMYEKQGRFFHIANAQLRRERIAKKEQKAKAEQEKAEE